MVGGEWSPTCLVLKVVQNLEQEFFLGEEQRVEAFLIPKAVPLVPGTEKNKNSVDPSIKGEYGKKAPRSKGRVYVRVMFSFRPSTNEPPLHVEVWKESVVAYVE